MTADLSTIADHLFGPLPVPPTFSTPSVIWAMLDSGTGISDLILSPGRPPQVERTASSSSVEVQGLSMLRVADTARLARDIIGDNRTALNALQGAGRLRPLLLAARAGALPRQRLPPARQLRHRHARDPVEGADAGRAQAAGRR